jgi:putative hydrolase of the HAD superfamily
LRFEAIEGSALALRQLRARGLRLVVVSNWDCSLPEVLADVGLLELVDAVVASAVVGAAKPDPLIFERALAEAGCEAADAVHVGDSVENDVEGARRVGIRPLLIGGDLRTVSDLPALLS